jgi:hypothetical protein
LTKTPDSQTTPRKEEIVGFHEKGFFSNDPAKCEKMKRPQPMYRSVAKRMEKIFQTDHWSTVAALPTLAIVEIADV